MSGQNSIHSKVPDCELQAILYSLNRTSWHAEDLFTLVEGHLDDSGSVGQITPAGLTVLTEAGRKVISRQYDLIQRLSEYLDVDSNKCELTHRGILCELEDVLSLEYAEALEKQKMEGKTNQAT